MIWSLISLLPIIVFLILLADHLGSRQVRKQVQRRAGMLFEAAFRQKVKEESISGHESWIQIWGDTPDFNPQTLRLKIKGAARSKGSWIPLEAKAFIIPTMSQCILYADETLGPFVSRKWVAQLVEGGDCLEYKRLLSVLPIPTGTSLLPEWHNPLVWFPWFRILPKGENQAFSSVKVGSGATLIQMGDSVLQIEKTEKEGIVVDFGYYQGEVTTFVYRWQWSQIKPFDDWQVPTRLVIFRQEGQAWRAERRLQLTEWSADDSFYWW